MNQMDPIKLFNEWYREEERITKVGIPSACCLSTIGLDGFPNARTVSLKEVMHDRFIITCPLNSRKAREIAYDSKVSLTFWWTATERQVRVQGMAVRISDGDADRYFAEREEHIKILSWASEQGQPLEGLELLRDRFYEIKEKFGSTVQRPEKWGGFAIEPIRIELMQFRQDRFHERWFYERRNGEWSGRLLQP